MRRPVLCAQCRTGYVVGTPKTFDERCRGCRQKQAAGLRTGNEPRPLSFVARIPHVDCDKLRAQRAAQRAQQFTWPKPKSII